MTQGLKRLSQAAVLTTLFLGVGCSYLGTARSFDPDVLARDPDWVAVKDVPLVLQKGEEDCGIAAIGMILAYWGYPVPREVILEACPSIPGRGVRAGDLRDFARGIGLQSFLVHGEWKDFESELGGGHPVLVGLLKPHVSGSLCHFEIVVAIHARTKEVVTLDPARGWRRNTFLGFQQEWEPTGRLSLVFFRKGPSPRAPEGGN